MYACVRVCVCDCVYCKSVGNSLRRLWLLLLAVAVSVCCMSMCLCVLCRCMAWHAVRTFVCSLVRSFVRYCKFCQSQLKCKKQDKVEQTSQGRILDRKQQKYVQTHTYTHKHTHTQTHSYTYHVTYKRTCINMHVASMGMSIGVCECGCTQWKILYFVAGIVVGWCLLLLLLFLFLVQFCGGYLWMLLFFRTVYVCMCFFYFLAVAYACNCVCICVLYDCLIACLSVCLFAIAGCIFHKLNLIQVFFCCFGDFCCLFRCCCCHCCSGHLYTLYVCTQQKCNIVSFN